MTECVNLITLILFPLTLGSTRMHLATAVCVVLSMVDFSLMLQVELSVVESIQFTH